MTIGYETKVHLSLVVGNSNTVMNTTWDPDDILISKKQKAYLDPSFIGRTLVFKNIDVVGKLSGQLRCLMEEHGKWQKETGKLE